MRLEYYAHACFAFTDRRGKRVLIDPYGPEVGYKLPQRPAEVTVISHDHFDHNHLAAVVGSTQVVRFPRQVEGFTFRSLLLDHDREGGALYGKVRAFCWEMDGLRLCHLSDLGRLLTAEEKQEIGSLDVLMLPCGGGGYTLCSSWARQLVAELKPRWALPMHYRTPFLNREMFPELEPVKAFLDGSLPVHGSSESAIELNPSPGPTEILHLAHRF